MKEAKAYYRLKGYPAIRPTCLVSIGTGQKDLIQLHEAASLFWFKDRTGLSIAPALAEIATDCENAHDEVTLSALDDNTAHLYYRFNVPQGMQRIALDEWKKADDIRTYTDKYMRMNETEHRLFECVKLLNSEVQGPQTNRAEESTGSHQPNSQTLFLTQGGSSYGPTNVSGGNAFQGNFAGFGRGPLGN